VFRCGWVFGVTKAIGISVLMRHALVVCGAPVRGRNGSG